MRDVLKVSKALADDTRLRILLLLDGKELCVCRVTEGLGLAPSTVSKHLSILEDAGLIETRKLGRWVHCKLPTAARSPAKGAIAWIFASARTGRKSTAKRS